MSKISPSKIVILISILIFIFCHPSFAKIVDKIVAIVNDEVITQSEVDRLLYPLYTQYRNIYKNEEELYKKLDESRLDILKQLINDKLILSEAKKLKIKVEEKEVDSQLAMIKNDLHSKGMDLNGLLSEQNLTLGDLREKYRDQIMIQKAVDQEIRAKIDIQPSEVNSYYSLHIDDYAQPQQVAVYSILTKLKSVRTPIESRQLADDIHKKLLDGYDFKELAKNYSEGPYREEGGDMGYIKRGQLLKEIDNVIFFLNVGEVSDVIETPIGYHIFKLYDRIEEKVLPLEEVRQKVIEDIFRIKAQEKFNAWLEKLRSGAYISIK